MTRLEATRIITEQAERIAELEEALDGSPDGSGMWRFWNDKARELASELIDLKADRDRMKEVIGAADDIRRVIKEMGIKRTPGLYQAIMAFDIARAALAKTTEL